MSAEIQDSAPGEPATPIQAEAALSASGDCFDKALGYLEVAATDPRFATPDFSIMRQTLKGIGEQMRKASSQARQQREQEASAPPTEDDRTEGG